MNESRIRYILRETKNFTKGNFHECRTKGETGKKREKRKAESNKGRVYSRDKKRQRKI